MCEWGSLLTLSVNVNRYIYDMPKLRIRDVYVWDFTMLWENVVQFFSLAFYIQSVVSGYMIFLFCSRILISQGGVIDNINNSQHSPKRVQWLTQLGSNKFVTFVLSNRRHPRLYGNAMSVRLSVSSCCSVLKANQTYNKKIRLQSTANFSTYFHE